MEQRELKMCPFCGGKANLIESVDNHIFWVKIVCGCCGANIKLGDTTGKYLIDNTIAAWNKRMEVKNG